MACWDDVLICWEEGPTRGLSFGWENGKLFLNERRYLLTSAGRLLSIRASRLSIESESAVNDGLPAKDGLVLGVRLQIIAQR